MKIVDIKTKIIPSNPRSKNYPIGYSGGIASNSNGVTPDLSIYLLKEIWERNIEERTDESGNEYLYIRKPLAIGGGATMYASNGVVVPSIFDGLPLDNTTIRKNPETGLIEVIGGSGSSFDENAMWSALAGSSENQINKSHLTTALDGYATRNWVIENYATKSELSAVSNKLNDFLEGSDTDNIINKWKELEAFLSGMAETDNLAEILKTKADRSYVDSTFVTLSTKQTITGEKTFSSVLNTAAIKASGAITAPSLAVSDYVTIAGIKLRKLEDGALMLEGNLAVTGGVTMYAVDPVTIPTIMDGIACDNTTIRVNPDTGVLEVLAASGEAGSVQWGNISGKPAWIGNSKPSYTWTEISGKPSTFAPSSHVHAISEVTNLQTALNAKVSSVEVTGTGNAITAASIASGKLTLTKGATFNNYTHPTATATTITAANGKVLSAITVNNQGHVTSVSGKTLAAADIPTLEISKISGLQDSLDAKLESSAYTAADVLAKLKTVDGSNSGLDADLLDGTHKTALFTALTSSSATNISITVGGTTKSIADLFANSAAKLETARTIWGQSFNGTKNITGALTSVTDITGTGTFTGANLKATDSVYVNGIRLHKTADGVITLEGNLAVTGGVTMYAIDPVSASTIMDGVVVDGTTIKKENGKLVAVGGGEAGSVAWGNISGKPSVFATNIANITDLHSSWDSVLAAQKPAWLTAVSIATISDLHANWDALLKAAPSAYVTRWPTISEVTGKQNLIVKLNGGTTEGTNQFTYNATGAKTINITPAGIGAATSGHTHAMSAITDLHSSWDALLKAAPSSYVTRWPSFSEVTSKPTTLAGYGITDAPTKTGSGASGTWGINISGNAGSATKLQTARTLWGNNFDGTTDVTGQINASNGIKLPYRGSIVTQFGNLLRTDYSEGDYNDFFELTARGSGSSENKLLGGNSGLLTWSGNRFIFNAYGVGWYAEDGEWMRTYNSLYVPKNVQCKGNIECDNKVICSTLQAKELDIAYGTNYKFVRMSWNGTSGDVASFFVPGSTSQWFTMELRSNGVLYTNGNILAEGGGTYYGSDIRYKSIMQQVELSLLSIANAPSFVYRWNKKGMKRDRLNLGGSAQYTQSILPWAVENSNNFLSMDYATVAYTFAVHTARHLMNYETRTDKKIKKLEREIVILKKQLKKLGYEEVRTLDDSGI